MGCAIQVEGQFDKSGLIITGDEDTGVYEFEYTTNPQLVKGKK